MLASSDAPAVVVVVISSADAPAPCHVTHCSIHTCGVIIILWVRGVVDLIACRVGSESWATGQGCESRDSRWN